MKQWKKNMIAAAILLVVCTGIYMNWMYSNSQSVSNLTDTLDAEKVLSEFPGCDLKIGENKGLCSFYAERGGIITAFEN